MAKAPDPVVLKGKDDFEIITQMSNLIKDWNKLGYAPRVAVTYNKWEKLLKAHCFSFAFTRRVLKFYMSGDVTLWGHVPGAGSHGQVELPDGTHYFRCK